MERQSVSKDNVQRYHQLRQTLGHRNDAPQYPLEIFLRVFTVSIETMKIVNGLPKQDITT